MLFSGQIGWDRTIDYTTGDSAPLQLQFANLALGLGDGGSRLLSTLFHLLTEFVTNGLNIVLANAETRVQLRNLLLQGRGQDVALHAALSPPGTEIVEVPAFSIGQAEPTATGLTEEHTLQVMRVIALPIPHIVKLQDFLDSAEELL